MRARVAFSGLVIAVVAVGGAHAGRRTQLQAPADREAERVDLDEFVVHHVHAVELPAVAAEPGPVRHGAGLVNCAISVMVDVSTTEIVLGTWSP